MTQSADENNKKMNNPDRQITVTDERALILVLIPIQLRNALI